MSDATQVPAPLASQGTIDTVALLEWLAAEPPPEEVLATRDEAMRRAEYMAGRDAVVRADMLRAARVVEWELARRWPEQGRPGPRTDDRPVLLSTHSNSNEQSWRRVYAVGRQSLDWIQSLNDPDALTQAKVIEGPPDPHVKHNSGENEWYTPPEYIEAARQVLGGIDLDPASSATAQLMVRAGRYFTAQDDGLVQPWHGTVWCNPPYAQPLIGRFAERLATHDAPWIALTNNGTETRWGAQLLASAGAVCFPTGRLRFMDPDGNPGGAPLQGQMVTYRGPDGDTFAAVFAKFGPVLHG